jgi:hypothetical protein
MEFPQGESMGSIYLSNLDVTLSNLGIRGAQGDRNSDHPDHPDHPVT